MKKSDKEVLYNGDNNGPYKKPFKRNWNGLEQWLEAKLFNLDKEEKAFTKREAKYLKSIKRKMPKLKGIEKEIYEKAIGWNQQKGKMVFIIGTLDMFFKNKRLGKKIIKERKWNFKKKKR